MKNIDNDEFSVQIPNNDRVKAFSAAIHLLHKVGKDMTIEIEGPLFVLRALNDSKSAFASVELSSAFFGHFYIKENLASYVCKVPLKPICTAFRNLKSVRHVRISARIVDAAEHELVFEMLLANGITRTYHFAHGDCEIVNAVFNEDADTSCVTAKPKVFTQILDHIHQSTEVSVSAGPEEFSLKSFHKKSSSNSRNPEVSASRGFMATGLSVNVQEFDTYDYKGGDVTQELIFSLREMLSFLAFCEALDLPYFQLFFSESGRPLKLHCSNDDLSSAVVDIILATVPVTHDHRSHEEQEAEAEVEAGVEPEAHADADADAHPDLPGDRGDGNYNEGEDREEEHVHQSGAPRNYYEPEPEQGSHRGQYVEQRSERNTSRSNNNNNNNRSAQKLNREIMDGGEQGHASTFLRRDSRVKPDASTQRRRRVVDDDDEDEEGIGGGDGDPYDEYEREFGNNNNNNNYNHREEAAAVVRNMPHKTDMSRTSEGISTTEDSMGQFMQSRRAEAEGVQVKKRTRRLLDESDDD